MFLDVKIKSECEKFAHLMQTVTKNKNQFFFKKKLKKILNFFSQKNEKNADFLKILNFQSNI